MIWSNFFVLVDVQKKTRKRRSALMAFCEALIATVPAYGVKPNKLISLEAVHCALNENRQDLLAHWVTQDRYWNKCSLSMQHC